MFSRPDLDYLKQLPYDIIVVNNHDATIQSRITNHEWIVVSNYDNPDCYILHRHFRRYPFHRQQGRYKDLKEALDYIEKHDSWFAEHKL